MLPYRIRDLEAEWLHGIWLIYYFYNGCDWIHALLCLWIHPVRLLLCSYCIFLSLQTWSQIQVEISEDKISSVENNHLRNSLKLYLNRTKSLGLLLELCVLQQFQFLSAISQWISFILVAVLWGRFSLSAQTMTRPRNRTTLRNRIWSCDIHYVKSWNRHW